MATVDLPAGLVSYRETGPADGPVVVFVHGFLVDDTLWADVPERLAERGFHCLAPTWPLGAHRTAMRPRADLSPRGIARAVASFLEALDLRDVVLVGNDTGGAVCQLLLDEDVSRVGRLVLTNCDAFDTFPPFPFDVLFRLARNDQRSAGSCCCRCDVGWVRTGRLGFGTLTQRRLTAAETRPWVTAYLADAGVRRDVATFARAWNGGELTGVGSSGWASSIVRYWSSGAAVIGVFERVDERDRLVVDVPRRTPRRGRRRRVPFVVAGPAGTAGRRDRRICRA